MEYIVVSARWSSNLFLIGCLELFTCLTSCISDHHQVISPALEDQTYLYSLLMLNSMEVNCLLTPFSNYQTPASLDYPSYHCPWWPPLTMYMWMGVVVHYLITNILSLLCERLTCTFIALFLLFISCVRLTCPLIALFLLFILCERLTCALNALFLLFILCVRLTAF